MSTEPLFLESDVELMRLPLPIRKALAGALSNEPGYPGRIELVLHRNAKGEIKAFELQTLVEGQVGSRRAGGGPLTDNHQ